MVDTSKLPPDAENLIKALDDGKAESHDRIAIGLFVAMVRAVKIGTLKDEQLLDLWRAGMYAHRMACSEGLLATIADVGRQQNKTHLSMSTVGAMGLMQSTYLSVATDKFLNLCEMLD